MKRFWTIAILINFAIVLFLCWTGFGEANSWLVMLATFSANFAGTVISLGVAGKVSWGNLLIYGFLNLVALSTMMIAVWDIGVALGLTALSPMLVIYNLVFAAFWLAVNWEEQVSE